MTNLLTASQFWEQVAANLRDRWKAERKALLSPDLIDVLFDRCVALLGYSADTLTLGVSNASALEFLLPYRGEIEQALVWPQRHFKVDIVLRKEGDSPDASIYQAVAERPSDQQKGEQYWLAALGELQLQLTKSNYDMWVRDTEFLARDSESNTFTIGVENSYAKDWLENRLLSTLKRTLTGITGKKADARFVVMDDGPDERPPGRTLEELATERAEQTRLCLERAGIPPRYWDAEIAALDLCSAIMLDPAVSEYLARLSQNQLPRRNLVIVGPNGVGKTHLAACILKQIVLAPAAPSALFVRADSLLKSLRQDFNTAQQEGRRLFDHAAQVTALVLDDLNPALSDTDATFTDWAARQINWLIAQRYENRLPTIVTTNNGTQVFAASEHFYPSVSRLFGNAMVAILPDDAHDYRFAPSEPGTIGLEGSLPTSSPRLKSGGSRHRT